MKSPRRRCWPMPPMATIPSFERGSPNGACRMSLVFGESRPSGGLEKFRCRRNEETELGRPPKLLRRDKKHQPISVKQLALSLAAELLGRVSWREGTKQKLRSRFAALRVRPAHPDYWRSDPCRGMVADRMADRGERTDKVLGFHSLRPAPHLWTLVKLAKHRWIIERDYEELKQNGD